MKLLTRMLIVLVLLVLGVSQLSAKPDPNSPVPKDVADMPPPPPTRAGAKDVFYFYGGPGTLEGKFETETGEPDRQGWTSHDLSVPEELPDGFQIDDYFCDNLDPSTPGNHAYWCGGHYPSCFPPYELDGGYGDDVDAGLEWEVLAPSAGDPTTGHLEFDLNYNVEPGYDYVFVEYFSASADAWVPLANYTGTGYGLHETVAFSLVASDYAGGDTIRLRFRVYSDGFLSTYNCGVGNGGACQIDNIQVFFDTPSGPVAQGPMETCEPGDPQNWQMINYAASGFVGDFAKVWPLLEESIPGALNTTPRWAFIDDGEVVPGLPGYTNGFDYGPGGFCVNADGGLMGPGHYINNTVRSPIIAIAPGVWTEAYFEYEQYLHQIYNTNYPTFAYWSVRSTTDPVGVDLWSDWLSDNLIYYGGPSVATQSRDLMPLIGPDATFLQVSFGIYQYPGYLDPFSSPAPYYDNAAVRFVGTPFVIPIFASEPEFTPGLNNTLAWDDESASGAANYWVECATDAAFAHPVADSGWIPGLSYEFTGLDDGQKYYYRMKYTNITLAESEWSVPVFSTQDATGPDSSADAQPAVQPALAFPVPYTASDAGSGVAAVELFYSVDGGSYSSFGSFSASPIAFVAPGEGLYSFYTVATDGVGNVEPAPATADATTQVSLPAAGPELSILPASSGPLNCSDTVLMTFHYSAAAGVPDLFLYDVTVRAGGTLSFGPVINLEPFGGGSTENFFALDNGDNSWTITGSTVASPSQPVTAPAEVDLFTIAFPVVSEGSSTVSLEQVTLRDPANNSFTGTWQEATITSDCTPPNPVSDLVAAPAHNKVQVGWQHDQQDVDHFTVLRALWYDGAPGTSAYPEYDDQPAATVPTRPASLALGLASAEWTLAGTVPAGGTSFTDAGMTTGRGVYYYEVFAVDGAANASGPAAQNDRATNYWLGDVNPEDGLVDVGDISLLGSFFGTAVPLNDPGSVVDVGPTDDWSATGIPLTDSFIDFEDLMMFSINFGVVSPAKQNSPGSSLVKLAWILEGEGTYALQLEDGAGCKGLRLRSQRPVSVVSVTAGELLDQQQQPVFLRNVGPSLDVSVAILGQGLGFTESGTLLRVQVVEPLEPEALTMEARGLDNSSLDISLSPAGNTSLPTVYALAANYPNPFNPMTTISFSLPETQLVRLGVYALDGREVRSLINEERAAGSYDILWQGRDNRGRMVASGTYFYCLEAGSYRQVRKMVLMK